MVTEKNKNTPVTTAATTKTAEIKCNNKYLAKLKKKYLVLFQFFFMLKMCFENCQDSFTLDESYLISFITRASSMRVLLNMNGSCFCVLDSILVANLFDVACFYASVSTTRSQDCRSCCSFLFCFCALFPGKGGPPLFPITTPRQPICQDCP